MKLANLPRGVPLYGFFSLPRGRLLKVCADPCMYSPGYLQSNGIPYSDDTVLKEFFNVVTLPDNSQWLIVTSIVEDPKYLRMPWVISTQFKKEVGADRKWRPTTCT